MNLRACEEREERVSFSSKGVLFFDEDDGVVFFHKLFIYLSDINSRNRRFGFVRFHGVRRLFPKKEVGCYLDWDVET